MAKLFDEQRHAAGISVNARHQKRVGMRQPAAHGKVGFHSLKRVEQQMRESKTRMRLATETTGVGIWEWELVSNKIRWDAQMFRIYGVQPTNDGVVEYATWADRVLPEDLAQQETVLQDTVRRLGQSARESAASSATLRLGAPSR